MSTLIRVEEVEPIEVGLILPDISEALRKILGLTYSPPVIAVDWIEYERELPDSHLIGPGKKEIIGIKPDEGKAIASVSTYEDQKYVYISPNRWRTALESALAAAVAVALAEYSDSEISDSALAFTREYSQPAEIFLKAIKAERTYYDVDEAAEEFGRRLGWK
jgi:hypothetical protein